MAVLCGSAAWLLLTACAAATQHACLPTRSHCSSLLPFACLLQHWEREHRL